MILLTTGLIYIFIGVIAGISSGLLGFGGGFFVVPVMYWGLKLLGVNTALLMHLAVGTSLAIMIFTAANSAYQHNKKGSIDWNVFGILCVALIIGSVFAAILAPHLQDSVLKYLFAFYLLITIIHSYFKKVFHDHETVSKIQLPNALMTQGFGFTVGSLATLLGVGGSVMTVPFFRRRHLPMSKAAAMAVILTLPISIVGAMGCILAGWHVNNLPAHSLGYVYWPAVIGVVSGSFLGVPIGTKLAYKIPDSILAKAYLGILTIVMVIMII